MPHHVVLAEPDDVRRKAVSVVGDRYRRPQAVAQTLRSDRGRDDEASAPERLDCLDLDPAADPQGTQHHVGVIQFILNGWHPADYLDPGPAPCLRGDYRVQIGAGQPQSGARAPRLDAGEDLLQ